MRAIKIFGKFCKGGPLGNECAFSMNGAGVDHNMHLIAKKYFPVINNGWGGPLVDAEDYARKFESSFLPELKDYIRRRNETVGNNRRNLNQKIAQVKITQVQYIRNWKEVKVEI